MITEKLELYDPLTAVRKAEYTVWARCLVSQNRLGDAFPPDELLKSALQEEEVGKSASSLSASLLSKRELEILELLAQRRSNAEIAATLYVSLSTVKQHNNRIFDKLGVKNRLGAATRAQELGLINK